MNLLNKDDIIKMQIPIIDPNCNLSVIYFLLQDNEIVYVGSSNKGLSRIYQHIRDKKFNAYSYIVVPPENRAKLENNYIFRFNPKYNYIPNYENMISLNVLQKQLKQKKVEKLYYKRELYKLFEKFGIPIIRWRQFELIYDLDYYQFLEKGREEGLWQ